MSGTGGIELEQLGQDALRMAHSLFAPAPVPASLPALDSLCTDPAECLNALFAPLTPFTHTTAASSPQPPESAAETSRDAMPVSLRTRQAEENATTAESPDGMGWANVLRTIPPDTRTALSSVPDVFSPPAMPVTFPMQTDASPQQAAGTAQSENRPLPDALTALRDLNALARTSLTLPATKEKHGLRKPDTLSASEPAASETAVPRSPDPLAELFARSLPTRNADRDGNVHKHDTRLPFLSAPPQAVDGPFSLRQENAKQDGNRQAVTPTAADQTGEETASAPLRLMRGASPLASMLQAHVQTPSPDTVPLPAPSHVASWPESQTDMPPDPFWPAQRSPRAAPAVQDWAMLPQDMPGNLPSPAAPPDMEAMIQALEAHLELEFLRTYGTSGR